MQFILQFWLDRLSLFQSLLSLIWFSLQISIMALNFIAKAPGNFLRFSQPRLKTFVQYAKVELTPPSPGELGQVKHYLDLYIWFATLQEPQRLIKKGFLTLIFLGCERNRRTGWRRNYFQVGTGQHGPGGCQHCGRCGGKIKCNSFMNVVNPTCVHIHSFRLRVGSSLENALEKDLLLVTKSRRDFHYHRPQTVESFRL